MYEFEILNVSSPGRLRFFNREPDDPGLPIETFSVEVSVPGLTATMLVWAWGAVALTSLFAEMAGRWRGWDGALAWESIEGELALSCEQDRTGHVIIEVGLCSGLAPGDWSIHAVIETEAGQLDRIARQAALFFGTQ